MYMMEHGEIVLSIGFITIVMSEIIGVYGLQGWGKTALTTYLGLRADTLGYPIHSNFKLGIDFNPVNTLKDAQNVRNGYLLLDEFWSWCHARTSQSLINREMMKICLLNRKRGVNIIYNSQLPRTIDVILREVTNYKYLPQMKLHVDGKMYIHYIAKDLMGNLSNWYIVPLPIDEIGKYFDTHAEIGDLTKQETPLQKGISLEHDFAKALKKVKGVNFVDVIPNSGNGSSWLYDVIAFTTIGNLCFDVKGNSATRVYYEDFGFCVNLSG